MKQFVPPMSEELRNHSRRVRNSQAKREQTLISDDQSYRRSEAMRLQAMDALVNGNAADIENSKSVPTPEQLAKGHFDPFTADTVKNTAVAVSTVRRRDVPVAHAQMMRGVISSSGLKACIWYRGLWEASGLLGNIPSTDYSKEVFASPAARSQLTDNQLEIADCIRFINTRISARHGRLLVEAILNDVPLKRAVRAARAFHRAPQEGFREAVDQLVDAKSDYEKC